MRKPNVTIETLENELGYVVNTTGMIKQSIALNSVLDFLTPYVAFADDLLMLNYSDFKIRKNITADNVKQYLASVFLSEQYNLKTIVGTLDFKYNPIENYRMEEKSTDKRELINAERISTNKINSALKSTISDIKHSVAPFNSSTLTNTEGDINTTTSQPYEDNNTLTENAHTDNDNLTHELTRYGNIGVTTSQQMIESERALANINVSSMLVKLVVKNICKGVQLIDSNCL